MMLSVIGRKKTNVTYRPPNSHRLTSKKRRFLMNESIRRLEISNQMSKNQHFNLRRSSGFSVMKFLLNFFGMALAVITFSNGNIRL